MTLEDNSKFIGDVAQAKQNHVDKKNGLNIYKCYEHSFYITLALTFTMNFF